MSKHGNEIVELNVTVDDMNEMENDAPVEDAPKSKPKKHLMSRFWALVLTIAPILVLCLLSMPLLVRTTLPETGGYAIETGKTYLDAFLALIGQIFDQDGIAHFYKEIENSPTVFEGYKLIVPLLAGNGLFGKLFSLWIYVIAIAVVLNVDLMLIALFSREKAPKIARAIAFIDLFVFGTYLFGILALSKFYFSKAPMAISFTSMPVLALGGIVAFALLFYIIYSFKKVKGVRAPNFFLLLFSAIWVGCFAYAYLFVETKTGNNVRIAILNGIENNAKSPLGFLSYADLFNYLVKGICVLSILNLFFSAVRLSTKKGFLFDVFRHILHFIVAGFCVFLAFTAEPMKKLDFMNLKLFVIVAAVVALLQIILAATTRARLKKEAKAEAARIAEENAEMEAVPLGTVAESTETESAESANEADNSVVAEKLTAEESATAAPVEPAATETPAPASDAPIAPAAPAAPVAASAPASKATRTASTVPGYDFLNGNTFDPFLASLNDEERQQFMEIFILKYHGEINNLPEYKVGGDNKEFFRKVFIFLGQHRDKIPSKLLSKMYKFSVKK